MTILKRVLPYVVISLVFTSFTLPLVFRPATIIFASNEGDEYFFHYPTILSFVQQFPHLDLTNYNSATAPLYHILMACVAGVIGTDIWKLRVVNFIISVLCLGVTYKYLSKQGNTFKALILSTIFMLSPYFWGPAVRLSTDNLALLFVFLFVLATDTNQPLTSMRSFLSNLFILLAIITRQIYAWLIGASLLIYFQKNKGGDLIRNWSRTILPILLPIAGVTYFLILWHGLTPPRFAVHTAIVLNWEAPIFIIVLLGLYSNFFIGWLLEMYKEIRGKWLPVILLAGLGIGCLLLHPVSNEYRRVGMVFRGGSLWIAASYLPNFLSTSIVFWVLFPLGLVYGFVFIRYLIAKDKYLLVVCFLLWLMTSIINTNIAQKYFEPFVLFFIASAVMMPNHENKRYYWIGPTILLMGLMAMILVNYFL